MSAIQVQVFCDAFSKEMTAYCYLRQEGQDLYIVANGCEESNDSPACQECFEKQRKLAMEQLTAVSNAADLRFNQP